MIFGNTIFHSLTNEIDFFNELILNTNKISLCHVIAYIKELQFHFQTNSVSCPGYHVPPPHSPPDKFWHRPFEVKLRVIETTADIIRGTQLLMCSAERISVSD